MAAKTKETQMAEQQAIFDKVEAYKTKHNVGDAVACKALGLKTWQAPYARKILKGKGGYKKKNKNFGKVLKRKMAKRTYNKKAPVMQTIELGTETESGKVLMMFGTVDSVCEAAKKLLVQ